MALQAVMKLFRLNFMRAIALILFAMLSWHAAASPGEDAIFSFAAPLAEPSLPARPAADSRLSEMLLYAISLSGTPYRYGGKTQQEGFDCSGFVAHVFKSTLNFLLPPNAAAMSRLGRNVSASELIPGDLVFFNTLANPYSHVGIYIGDDRFIHSPRSGRKIEIVHMQHRYWATRFDGARRLLSLE